MKVESYNSQTNIFKLVGSQGPITSYSRWWCHSFSLITCKNETKCWWNCYVYTLLNMFVSCLFVFAFFYFLLEYQFTYKTHNTYTICAATTTSSVDPSSGLTISVSGNFSRYVQEMDLTSNPNPILLWLESEVNLTSTLLVSDVKRTSPVECWPSWSL